MSEKVKQLIISLGYELSEDDEVLLDFAIADGVAKAKAICNAAGPGGECEAEIVKYAAGIFLKLIKNSGKTDSFAKNLEAGIKSISEGDVSITYGGMTSDEERLDNLIAFLCSGMERLSVNRRIKW